MNRIRCPKCNAECDPGEPSCPLCGRYLGARRREPVLPAQPGHEEDETFGIPRPIWWFLNMFPGLFSPGVIIMAVIAMAIAGVLTWLALFLFIFGAMFSAFTIGAAGIVCYWTAIAWLMYGELAAPSEVLSEFNSTQWLVFVLLGLLPLMATAIWVGGSPTA